MIDLLDDPIRRRRNVKEPALIEQDYSSSIAHAIIPDWITQFLSVSDEDLLTGIQAFLAEDTPRPKILPSRDTSLAHSKWGRLDPPAFYLKNSQSQVRRALHRPWSSCREASATANCTYVDQHASQYRDLAEWGAYGPACSSNASVQPGCRRSPVGRPGASNLPS